MGRQASYCKGCGKLIDGVHSCARLATTSHDLKVDLANELHEKLSIDLFDEEGSLEEAELDSLVAKVAKYIVLARKYL